MAALRGLGVDNVLVEIDGPEVPILDGSAAPFVDAIDQVGIVHSGARRRYLKVLKPVRVDAGQGLRRAASRTTGLPPRSRDRFPDADDRPPAQGRSICRLPRSAREISRARTFGFMRDVEKLWNAGFALGASLENTVAIGEDGVINPEGLRYRRRVRPPQDPRRRRRPGACRLCRCSATYRSYLRRPPHQFLGARGPVLRPLQLRHRRCRRRAARRGYAEIGGDIAVAGLRSGSSLKSFGVTACARRSLHIRWLTAVRALADASLRLIARRTDRGEACAMGLALCCPLRVKSLCASLQVARI